MSVAARRVGAFGAKALVLLLVGCGGAAPARSEAPSAADVDAHEAPSRPAATEAEAPPHPRVAALPPAPRMAVEIDMEVLRRTPLYEQLRREMRNDRDPETVVGRFVVERARRLSLGAYGPDAELVLVARGGGAGLVEEAVAAIRADGRELTPAERLGFRLYYLSDDMVVAQTDDDTVVIAYPDWIGEVLRTAAGQAPVTPLPGPLERLRARPAFADAPMHLVFRSRSARPRPTDPLAALVAEAGWVGVAGRPEGADLVVTGAARLDGAQRAAQLAAELERSARQVSERDVRSAELAAGVRAATVRTDAEWVEVELRFPAEELQAFMDLLDPL